MNFISGLLKRLGLIAVTALTMYGAGQLWWSYDRSAAMQRHGVTAELSPVLDACLDALGAFHKKFKSMSSKDGCACAVAEMAKAPAFEEAAAIRGVRAMLGPKPALPEQFGLPFPPNAEAKPVAREHVVRAAMNFGAAVKKCSGGEIAAAPATSRGA